MYPGSGLLHSGPGLQARPGLLHSRPGLQASSGLLRPSSDHLLPADLPDFRVPLAEVVPPERLLPAGLLDLRPCEDLRGSGL
jgi:hypothetical protein